jgi:hypothetical protein
MFVPNQRFHHFLAFSCNQQPHATPKIKAAICSQMRGQQRFSCNLQPNAQLAKIQVNQEKRS